MTSKKPISAPLVAGQSPPRETGEPPRETEAGLRFLVTVTHELVEPRLRVRFCPGRPTPCPEYTEWMKCQVEAGLMTVKEAVQ